ncbi:MAG: hypothetical protein ABI311_09610 [Gemmatimonadaceae bacterium]
MADKSATPEVTPETPATPVAPPTVPPPPKRSPGHRGADVKDTVAEMTAKAHEISLEAGSKMAAAMKDVVNAAAGLTGFVLESARDLVQYMVRRGQMTQEEADKLIRQAEDAQVGRPAPPPRAPEPEPAPKAVAAAPAAHVPPPAVPVVHAAPEAPQAPKPAPPAVPKTAHTAKTDTDPKAANKPASPNAVPVKPAVAKPVAAKPEAKAADKKPAAKTADKSDRAVAKKPVAKTAAKKATAKHK